MYELGYATAYRQNDYRIVEQEIDKITLKQFEKRAKEISKENHPVRFVYLEDDKKGIVALYRDGKISLNKIWKLPQQTTKTKPKSKRSKK